MCVGGGGSDGCERRSEALVKIQYLFIFYFFIFFFGGGGGVGSGGQVGGSGWM